MVACPSVRLMSGPVALSDGQSVRGVRPSVGEAEFRNHPSAGEEEVSLSPSLFLPVSSPSSPE